MDFGSGNSLASSNVATMTLSAGGPGSGPRPSMVTRHDTENALRSHGFQLKSKDANSSTFTKNMSKPWNSTVDAQHHMHTATVSKDGSFSYTREAGQSKPITGKGSSDVNEKVGPQVKEKVATVRTIAPHEALAPRVQASGIEARQFDTKKRKKLAKTGAAMKDGSYPIVTAEDLHNAVQSIGRAKNPEATKAHIKTRAKALGLTKSLPDGWSKKEVAAAGFGDDDQRKAFFAKTVGGHNDAAAIHEDLGDYHTAQATKLASSTSVKAPKLAAAHTQAATAHYAASEMHSDAASDLTKANTNAAQTASQNAYKVSSKTDSLPKPKGFSASALALAIEARSKPASSMKKVAKLHKKLTDNGFKFDGSKKSKNLSVHHYTHSTNGSTSKIVETAADAFTTSPQKPEVAAGQGKVDGQTPKIPVDYTLPSNALGRPGTDDDPFDLEVDDVSVTVDR